jgi:hypothetical protein
MTSPMGLIEIERQKRSNSNAARYYGAFANHRRHLTDLLMARASKVALAQAGGGQRLCVLGAGNCGDLDLERLASSYHSIHLVDIDEAAIERAIARQTKKTRAKLVAHAPIDLSGLIGSLDRWRDMGVTVDELFAHPTLTSQSISESLRGLFDVVVSACVLSQMHLAVRNVLSDTHQLFQAASYTVTLTHLRTLARLTEPGGLALLASDIATEQMAPLQGVDEHSDCRALLARQISSGDVFDAVQPSAIVSIARDDPTLQRELGRAQLADAWVWHNGDTRIFLVYALDLERLTGPVSPDALQK